MFGQLFALFELGAFRNAFWIRGALVWVLIRLALAFHHFLNPASASLDPEPLAEVGIVGAVCLVVFLDARRRSEDVLLANLGIDSWAIGMMAFPVVLLLEILVP